MKKKKTAVTFVLLIMLGMTLHSLLQQTVQTFSERASGNVGGEILILPLIVLLIWLGWQLRGIFDTK